MKIDKPKLKKIIAKEILLFFAGLLLILVVWGFLNLRNSYYQHKKETLQGELELTKNEVDTLPIDKIKILYNAIEKTFGYEFLNNDTIVFVSKSDSVLFREKFPNASFKTSSDALYLFEPNEFILWDDGTYSVAKLSGDYCFKWMDFQKFKNVLANDSIRKIVFIVTNSYKGNLTELEFNAKINNSLKGYDEREKLRIILTLKLQQLESDLAKTNSHILVSGVIQADVNNILLVIFILLYPLRICWLLILWSYRTVKDNDKKS
jgi:hypothetical protein